MGKDMNKFKPLFYFQHLDPERIRDERERIGLTREALGSKIGLTGIEVRGLECGKRECSYEMFLKLINLLDTLPIRLSTLCNLPKMRFEDCHFRPNSR